MTTRSQLRVVIGVLLCLPDLATQAADKGSGAALLAKLREGDNFREIAQYAQAETAYRAAEAIAASRGFDDERGVVLARLAYVRRDQGRYSDAESLSRNALELVRDHANAAYLSALGALAGTLCEKGAYEEAANAAREALTIAERQSDHNDLYVDLLNTLGLIRLRQGDAARAIPLARKVVAMIERRTTGAEMKLAQAYQNLAVALLADGDHTAARDYANRALLIADRDFPAASPLHVLIRGTLIELNRKEKRFEEAEALIAATLPRARATLSEDTPDLVAFLNTCAVTYAKERRYPEAADLLREALGIQDRVLGPLHPASATLLINYRYVLRKTHRKDPVLAANSALPR